MLYALFDLFTKIESQKKRLGVIDTKPYILQVKKSNRKYLK